MTATTLLRETWDGFLDLLYPPRCLVCREFGSEVICHECRADFFQHDPPFCDRCGITVASRPTGLCANCETRTLYFRQACAYGHYDGALRQAILNFKYGSKQRLAEPLGVLLAAHLSDNPFSGGTPDVIVPVPLHPSRHRERGFNQSALLARAIGRDLELPVSEHAMVRTRKTRPQAGLNAADRQENVRDAFAVRAPDQIYGKSVLLVDDVLTTLHTVDECARMLSAAGASVVLVAALARGS